MSLLEAGQLHPNVAAGGAGPAQEVPREGQGPKELLFWCSSPATHTPGRKVAELRGRERVTGVQGPPSRL